MAQLDEALDLKRRARRRLIGAIALVLFLVIVPPWIMDLEPKPVETTLEVEIPKPEDRPLPPAAPADSAAAPAEQAQSSPPATAAPEPATPESEAPDTAKADPSPPKTPPSETKAAAAPKTETAPKAEPKAQAETKADSKGEAYIVPVATLSTQGNVKELQAKLSLAGLDSYTEPVKTASGQHTRVRAGPFTSKADAEKAHARLREMGLKPGNVTTR